jgi:dissimilatory sulfite reductase (desulfoviridin) alpha/beta subunit
MQDDIFHAVKAIVACQRDYGRRDDRKQARLKYLVSEWGIDKFRSVTEQYFGKTFAPFQPLPAWEFHDYLGWGEQGDGNLYFGCFIQNGRLKGEMKAALRRVIEEYALPVRITPNQNLILCNVQPQWRDAVEHQLRAVGIVPPDELDSLDRFSMACPALPLCGLAIGEAERGLPDVNARVRRMLDQLGLEGETIVMRMTGCANGCAPPRLLPHCRPPASPMFMHALPALTRCQRCCHKVICTVACMIGSVHLLAHRILDLEQQSAISAPAGVRGRTWPSSDLSATAQTRTSSGSAAIARRPRWHRRTRSA